MQLSRLQKRIGVGVFIILMSQLWFSSKVAHPQEEDVNLVEVTENIIDLSNDLRFQDISLAILKLQEELLEAEPERQLDILLDLTEFTFREDQIEVAQTYAQELLEKAQNNNAHDYMEIAELYLDFLRVMHSGLSTDASHFMPNVDVESHSSNLKVQLVAHNLHGLVADQYGQNYVAEKHYRAALKIAEQYQNSSYWKIAADIQLATLLSRRGLSNSGFVTLENALREAKETGATVDVGEILYKTGYVLFLRNELELAEKQFHALLDFDELAGREGKVFNASYGLARVYQAMERYQDSYDVAESMLLSDYATEDFMIALAQIQAINATQIGKLAIAENLRRDIGDYFELHPDFKDTYWGLRTFLVDAFIARARGDFEAALAFQKTFYERTQRLESIDYYTSAFELQSEYEKQALLQSELLEQQRQATNAELTVQRILLAFVAVVALLFSVAFFYKNRASAAFKKAAHAAEEMNRAKSIFLATMSHEIRTPLNAIIGFSDSLMLGINADNKIERNKTLALISQSGRYLNNLLADILDLSRVEAGKMNFDFQIQAPTDVIENNIPILRKVAEENEVSITFQLESKSKISVDKSRLSQILLNYVSNAAKYSKRGGSIIVSCVDLDEKVRIYVQDNGIGIADDKLDYIFDIFTRGDPALVNAEGVGLGLSICKALASQMNGKVGVISKLGEGSTFWVDFPECVVEQAKAAE